MQFSFEQEAMNEAPIPDGLKQWEQNAYIALRGLYRQYRDGVVDRETATIEKRRIAKAARDAENTEVFQDKLIRANVSLWREIEAAGCAYAKDRTLENADAFYRAVYRVKNRSDVKEVLYDKSGK